MTQAERDPQPDPAKNISLTVNQTTGRIEGGSQAGVPIPTPALTKQILSQERICFWVIRLPQDATQRLAWGYLWVFSQSWISISALALS